MQIEIRQKIEFKNFKRRFRALKRKKERREVIVRSSYTQ
jgi:hypothetical protein